MVLRPLPSAAVAMAGLGRTYSVHSRPKTTFRKSTLITGVEALCTARRVRKRGVRSRFRTRAGIRDAIPETNEERPSRSWPHPRATLEARLHCQAFQMRTKIWPSVHLAYTSPE